MPVLRRISGTDLFVPEVDSNLAIRYVCLPLYPPTDETLNLVDHWPQVRILFWSRPVPATEEAFSDLLDRVKETLSTTNDNLILGFDNDWSDPSKAIWLAVNNEGNLDTFSCDFDGGRYRLEAFTGAKLELINEKVQLSGPTENPPLFISKLPSGASGIPKNVKLIGSINISLSSDGGTLGFQVELTQKNLSDFGLEMRISESTPDEFDGTAIINSSHYIPLHGVEESAASGDQVLKLEASVDPLDTSDPERSYFELSDGSPVEVQCAASDGNPLRMVATRHKILSHAGGVEKERPPRFYFNKQSRMLDSDSLEPIKNWQSLELDGAFSLISSNPSIAEDTPIPDRDILTGLSDTETFRLRSDERLVFRRGGPAFLPSRKPQSGEAGLSAATQDDIPALRDSLTMSWIGVESADGAPRTRVVSEGSNNRILSLYDDGSLSSEPSAAGNQAQAIRLEHSPLELQPQANDPAFSSDDADPLANVLPILPFLGRPIDLGEPDSSEIELEKAVIQPIRRRMLTPAGGVSLAADGEDDIRTTPSGLRVKVVDGKVNELFLTKTLYKDLPPFELSVTDIADDLADALMRDQLFLIANSFDKDESVGKLKGSINIGGWTLDMKFEREPGDPKNIPLAQEFGGFLIIKDDERPLKELIERPDLWAGYDVKDGKNRFVDDIEAAQNKLREHFTREEREEDPGGLLARRNNATKETRAAYDKIAAIWGADDAPEGDKGWRGVLLMKPGLDLGELPEQLAAMAAAIQGEKIHADFLGIDFNRLKKANNKLEIRTSPVFGLIDYFDNGAEDKVKDTGEDFNVALERLIVRFENGAVQNFYAKLLLLVRALFDLPVNDTEGGVDGSDTKSKNIIEIEGSRESRLVKGEKQDIYTFQNQQDWSYEFTGKDSILKKISMTRLAYATTKATHQSDGPRNIESQFSISGSVVFNPEFPSQFPLIKLDAVKFKDLNIDINFSIIDGATQPLKSFFRPTNFSLDFKSVEGERDGFFSKLPFKPVGFEWWKNTITLDKLGFFGFGINLSDEGLLSTDFKYGLKFDLDMGSLGSLGSKLKDFKLSALLGWRQGGESDSSLGKTRFCIGFKLEGNGSDDLDIGIGNVLRIKADKYDIEKQDDVYFIYAVNAKLIILGETFPESSRLNLFMFVDSNSPSFSSLGWLAVFTNTDDSDESIIDLQTLATGQRIDPFSGDVQRRSVKELMNQIDALGREVDKDKLEQINEKGEITPILELLKNGAIKYAPNSAWTVALRSRLFDTFDLDFVLRDPDLYGLRVAFNNGFSLDIAYRKLTEELGVYSTEIALPESMRYIQLGAASITIGVIGLEIFTDGGVAVDLGYPANRNFERAFGAEVIPFTGSAGFKIARVSGAGSRMIPKPVNNAYEYNPVTEIAMGGRFGLGKTFRKGPLKASLSVTIYSYLSGAQGVLWRKPESSSQPEPDPGMMPKGTYVVIAGTVGIMGEVYGYVDFGIIKAGVAIQVYIESGVVFETDRATLIFMEAGVSVRCVVVIGRIKIFGKKIEIKVSYSFATTLRYQWELGSTRAGYSSIYNRSGVAPLSVDPAAMIAEFADPTTPLSWDEVHLPVPKNWRSDGNDAPLNLELSLVPDLTFARYLDEDDGLTAYPEVVLLLTAPVRDPAAAEEDGELPTPFEQLIQALVFWSVAVNKGWITADVMPDSPLEEKVSIRELRHLNSRLAAGDEHSGDYGDARSQYARTPLYELLKAFLKQNFSISIGALPEDEGRENHSFFPMPEDIEILRHNFPSGPSSVKLWETDFVDSDYRDEIELNFARLAVDLEQRESSLAALTGEEPASLASVIFEEHLGLLMRTGVDQLIQLMQDSYAADGNTTGTVMDDYSMTLRNAFQLFAIREVQNSDGSTESRRPVSETAAFASRFFLHGLNLPNPSMTALNPDAPKVPKPIIDLYKADGRRQGWPLYRLASLQLPLFEAAIPEDESYVIELNKKADEEWFTLNSLTPPLFTLDDHEIYKKVARTQSEVAEFVGELVVDTTLPITATHQEHLPLGTRFDLREENDHGDLVLKNVLWRLPTDLLQPSRLSRKNIKLKVRKRLNRGPGAEVFEVAEPKWSISVELKVQQIKTKMDSNGNAAAISNIYQIGGVDEDMRRLLDAVVMAAYPSDSTPEIQRDDIAVSLYALSPPSSELPSGTYERIDQSGAARIVQINLSSEPRPQLGTGPAPAAAGDDDELIEASTAESMQFVELVRRASIVNSGGYYLHTESEAVRTLFDAPSTDTEPRLGEHNDPFLLLVVNINAEVGADIEADVDPTVITNALMAPFSSLNNVDLDKPDSDGSENSEFDWNAPFLESGTTIHEPIHAPGVVPLRFKLPDPDPVAEADTDNIVADMCTRFTMLDYAVPKSIEDGNNIWIRSGDGLQFHETLPVGPTEPNGKGSEKDMPMLHFDLNIPAARLLVDEEDSSADLINPYGAVGEELTILYRLRDIYGNSIGAEHTHKQKIQFIDRIARISDLPLLSMLWKPEYNSPDFGRGLHLSLSMGGSTLALSSDDDSDEKTADKARAFAREYRRVIHQLQARHSYVRIKTSLNGSQPIDFSSTAMDELKNFLEDCAKNLDELNYFDILGEFTLPLEGIPDDGDDDDQFVEVEVRLVQGRYPEWVAGERTEDEEKTDPMVRVESIIEPGYLAQQNEQERALDEFAFTLGKIVEGFLVAVGPKRSAGTGQETLWLVPEEVLDVSMPDDFASNGPAYYAIRPLSTKLESFVLEDFPLYETLNSDSGSFDTIDKQLLVDKDMDDFGRTVAERIDRVLSPDMVKALIEKTPDSARNHLRTLLRAKESAAGFFAGRVAPILERDDEDSDERLTQGLKRKIGIDDNSPLQDRLKRRLSAAYELDTVLAYPLEFRESSGADNGLPLLFGNMTFNDEESTDNKVRSFSYDTAVIQAQHENAALISMLDVYDLVPKDIYKHRLTYKITHVQRIPWPDRWDVFTELSSEKRYRNTAWLRLVVPMDVLEDTAASIPVPLRDFPNQLAIKYSTALPSNTVLDKDKDTSLVERICTARSWDYELGWIWDSVEQDELEIKVSYTDNEQNLAVAGDDGTSPVESDKLEAIARFVTATDELWQQVLAFAHQSTDPASEKLAIQYFVTEAELLGTALQGAQLATTEEELDENIDQIKVKLDGDTLELTEDKVKVAKAVQVDRGEINEPFARFTDIDILVFRTAQSQLNLRRNATFKADLESTERALQARQDFIYQVGGVRTADPVMPRNEIAGDFIISVTEGKTLKQALESFFELLLDSSLCNESQTDMNVAGAVALDIECCYLSGLLDAYYPNDLAPGQRPPGAEMGKLTNLYADPDSCSTEVDNLVSGWLELKSVPHSDNGWSGKLRLQVALFQQGDESTADRPFLLLRRCILPLDTIVREE